MSNQYVRTIESIEQTRARFYAHVVDDGDCQVWTASLDRNGYGQFSFQSKICRAHRIAWMLDNRPLLDTDILDHICNRRNCVNLIHLRILTQWQNVSRSQDNPVAINSRKTHCVHGHEYTPVNTGRDKHGWRYCKRCRVSK